jgi:ribonuclease BN (tRNA processing enzyme)
MDRLLLLGVGTCQIEAGRATSAALVEIGGWRLVFDFGRGTASRLVELGLRQDDVEHVVLSHFHPDHLSDLIPYLHAAAHSRIDPRSRNLTIWGPPGVDDQIGRLLSLFEPGSLEVRERFEVRTVTADGPEIEIAGRTLGYGSLPPAGNHGLKWTVGGKTYALTGDSDFHESEVAFLRGVDVAVFDSGHLSDDEIVKLAAASQVRCLVCSHLYRALDVDELTARAARAGYRGRIVLGHDLLEIPLGASG